MVLLNQIFDSISGFLEYISTLYFILIFGLFIIIIHILLHLFRDKHLIKIIQENKDPEINKLKVVPLLNIIIPAWKEGKEFQDCLSSITELKYPKLRVIVNAGGNEETINIANSFKSHDYFTVLHQTGGKDRAALGKIHALNECLEHISEGILYLIDADCYLTDDLVSRMVAPIILNNEKIVVGAGLRPLIPQERIILVQYLHFSRFGYHKFKFTRYYKSYVSGANTCITHDVIKEIGKFSEDRKFAEDTSRGTDIASKGYKIFALSDSRSKIFTHYPDTLKEHIQQRRRNLENSIIFSYQTKFYKGIIKLLFLFLLSFYILVFPLFLLFNIGLFFIGVFLFLSIYLKRIRLYISIKKLEDKATTIKYSKGLFIKMIFYIYIEIISNVITPFHFIKYNRELKKEGSNS